MSENAIAVIILLVLFGVLIRHVVMANRIAKRTKKDENDDSSQSKE